MPRGPRLIVPGLPLHVVQRGVNREPIFRAPAHFAMYLRLLEASTSEHSCALHAYVLMTNHVHLLFTPNSANGAARVMKQVGEQYAQFVNRIRARTGGLFEGRFRSSLVESDSYFLKCHCYIELNPVRASMVSHPGDYPWSSYRVNAEGARSDLITPHVEYLALGPEPDSRRERYRSLFAREGVRSDLDQIRRALVSGTVVGSDRFAAAFERYFGRPVTPQRRGPKPKRHVNADEDVSRNNPHFGSVPK